MNPKLPILQQQSGDGGGGGGGTAPAPSPAAPAPSPAPTPPAAWYSDSHKDYVANKGFKTADDALLSLQNAEKLIGAEKAGRTVVLPKDEKDAEGIKAFREKLGVPAKPEEYGLPIPDGHADDFAKVASGWFHELGIPKAAGVALATKWNEHVQAFIKDADAKLAAESSRQLDGLKVEWGDKFDANSEHARRFLKASGWDEAKVRRYEEVFGTADMLKTFHGLGLKMGEPDFMKGDGQSGSSVSPAEARRQLEEAREKRVNGKMSDKDFFAIQERLAPIASAA